MGSEATCRVNVPWPRRSGAALPCRRRERVNFDDWLQVGLANAWVAEGFCLTHDAPPMTPAEQADVEAGYDPCLPGLRVWADNT